MAHTDLAGSLSPSRVMEKSPMPVTPPAGYLPERPCSTMPDNDSPPGSPPKDSYSRQNPFGISQQQPPEDDEMNTRGGGRDGRGGGLCEVLLAACCCYALCEICC
ncbi:hypothetical protein INS49_013973 [Diaporthe citri]|uniref:uncharacterized protein n=1 Tax=Diaporthe citri TaxID=83186 RepID=UPI001C822105|nr:uncharacterized protein INS49_013973 [Diaporthe citri]KAG6358089.1 hypothetical protein INS49_013973 [Diaporthe citri]